MSGQWVSPVHTTSPTADYERWGEIFRERGWLDPAAAEQLRAERDALLDLRDKVRAWRRSWDPPLYGEDRLFQRARATDALLAAVNALEPTEGAQP